LDAFPADLRQTDASARQQVAVNKAFFSDTALIEEIIAILDNRYLHFFTVFYGTGSIYDPIVAQSGQHRPRTARR